jgi:hypothetical protein
VTIKILTADESEGKSQAAFHDYKEIKWQFFIQEPEIRISHILCDSYTFNQIMIPFRDENGYRRSQGHHRDRRHYNHRSMKTVESNKSKRSGTLGRIDSESMNETA